MTATGQVKIEGPHPTILDLVCAPGGTVSMVVPFPDGGLELWQDKKFTVQFEPKRKEFWVSDNKGTVKAGDVNMPFTVFFAASSAAPIETLMFVDMEGIQGVYRIIGKGPEAAPKKKPRKKKGAAAADTEPTPAPGADDA